MKKDRYFLWSIFFFIFIGTGASQPYVNIYLKNVLSLFSFKFSSILASVYISMACTRFTAPGIINHIGIKKSITLGSFSYFLFALFFVIFRKYPLFLLSAIVWGIGASILWTATLTLILNISRRERFGIENGLLRFFLHIGLISGFLILGEIFEYKGFSHLFITASIFAFLGFLSSLFISESKKGKKLPLLTFSFSKKLIIFAIGLFIGAIGYSVILNLLNHFIIENFGKNILNKTIVFFYISAGILSIIGGKVIDKTGEYPACIIFFLLSSIFLFLFSKFQNLFLTVLSTLSLGGLFQIVPIAVSVRIGKLFGEEERSRKIASLFLWRDLGIGSGIISLGLLKIKFSYTIIFYSISIMFFSMFLLFSFFWYLSSYENKPAFSRN